MANGEEQGGGGTPAQVGGEVVEYDIGAEPCTGTGIQWTAAELDGALAGSVTALLHEHGSSAGLRGGPQHPDCGHASVLSQCGTSIAVANRVDSVRDNGEMSDGLNAGDRWSGFGDPSGRGLPAHRDRRRVRARRGRQYSIGHTRAFLQDMDATNWGRVRPAGAALSGGDYRRVWRRLSGEER